MTEKKRSIGIRILVIVLAVIVIFLMNTIALESDTVIQFTQTYGYIGIFIAAVVSGFNIIVPIPIATFFPVFVEAGLAPLLIIFIISCGMVIGDMLGYLIGYSGRDVSKSEKVRRFQKKIEALQERHHLLPHIFMFLYAGFVPLPNELVVIPLGYARVKFWKIMTAIFFGNIIFVTLTAYGTQQLFSLI